MLARKDGSRFARESGLGLQETAETVGLDKEVHVSRWLRFPVSGDQLVEVVADRLARFGQVERDGRKPVGAVEHAVRFHAFACRDPSQPPPFLVGEFVAIAQRLRCAADLTAQRPFGTLPSGTRNILRCSLYHS